MNHLIINKKQHTIANSPQPRDNLLWFEDCNIGEEILSEGSDDKRIVRISTLDKNMDNTPLSIKSVNSIRGINFRERNSVSNTCDKSLSSLHAIWKGFRSSDHSTNNTNKPKSKSVELEISKMLKSMAEERKNLTMDSSSKISKNLNIESSYVTMKNIDTPFISMRDIEMINID